MSSKTVISDQYRGDEKNDYKQEEFLDKNERKTGLHRNSIEQTKKEILKNGREESHFTPAETDKFANVIEDCLDKDIEYVSTGNENKILITSTEEENEYYDTQLEDIDDSNNDRANKEQQQILIELQQQLKKQQKQIQQLQQQQKLNIDPENKHDYYGTQLEDIEDSTKDRANKERKQILIELQQQLKKQQQQIQQLQQQQNLNIDPENKPISDDSKTRSFEKSGSNCIACNNLTKTDSKCNKACNKKTSENNVKKKSNGDTSRISYEEYKDEETHFYSCSETVENLKQICKNDEYENEATESDKSDQKQSHEKEPHLENEHETELKNSETNEEESVKSSKTVISDQYRGDEENDYKQEDFLEKNERKTGLRRNSIEQTKKEILKNGREESHLTPAEIDKFANVIEDVLDKNMKYELTGNENKVLITSTEDYYETQLDTESNGVQSREGGKESNQIKKEGTAIKFEPNIKSYQPYCYTSPMFSCPKTFSSCNPCRYTRINSSYTSPLNNFAPCSSTKPASCYTPPMNHSAPCNIPKTFPTPRYQCSMRQNSQSPFCKSHIDSFRPCSTTRSYSFGRQSNDFCKTDSSRKPSSCCPYDPLYCLYKFNYNNNSCKYEDELISKYCSPIAGCKNAISGAQTCATKSGDESAEDTKDEPQCCKTKDCVTCLQTSIIFGRKMPNICCTPTTESCIPCNCTGMISSPPMALRRHDSCSFSKPHKPAQLDICELCSPDKMKSCCSTKPSPCQANSCGKKKPCCMPPSSLCKSCKPCKLVNLKSSCDSCCNPPFDTCMVCAGQDLDHQVTIPCNTHPPCKCNKQKPRCKKSINSSIVKNRINSKSSCNSQCKQQNRAGLCVKSPPCLCELCSSSMSKPCCPPKSPCYPPETPCSSQTPSYCPGKSSCCPPKSPRCPPKSTRCPPKTNPCRTGDSCKQKPCCMPPSSLCKNCKPCQLTSLKCSCDSCCESPFSACQVCVIPESQYNQHKRQSIPKPCNSPRLDTCQLPSNSTACCEPLSIPCKIRRNYHQHFKKQPQSDPCSDCFLDSRYPRENKRPPRPKNWCPSMKSNYSKIACELICKSMTKTCCYDIQSIPNEPNIEELEENNSRSSRMSSPSPLSEPTSPKPSKSPKPTSPIPSKSPESTSPKPSKSPEPTSPKPSKSPESTSHKPPKSPEPKSPKLPSTTSDNLVPPSVPKSKSKTEAGTPPSSPPTFESDTQPGDPEPKPHKWQKEVSVKSPKKVESDCCCPCPPVGCGSTTQGYFSRLYAPRFITNSRPSSSVVLKRCFNHCP